MEHRTEPTSEIPASGSISEEPSRTSHPKAKRILEVVEFVGFTIVVSVLLQVAAGPTGYWQAGVFALVIFACVLPMLLYFAEHRDLFKRRISFGPGAEPTISQKIIVSCLLLLFAALYVVCGLDHRFTWSHVPVPVVIVGDLLVASGLVLIFLVLQANPFAAATVTVEAEQSVMATGLYARVRHPMYSGHLLFLLGIPLALGSWWGLFITFLPFLGLFIWRLVDEEHYLSTRLSGYRDYCTKVPHRLIPAIW